MAGNKMHTRNKGTKRIILAAPGSWKADATQLHLLLFMTTTSRSLAPGRWWRGRAYARVEMPSLPASLHPVTLAFLPLFLYLVNTEHCSLPRPSHTWSCFSLSFGNLSFLPGSVLGSSMSLTYLRRKSFQRHHKRDNWKTVGVHSHLRSYPYTHRLWKGSYHILGSKLTFFWPPSHGWNPGRTPWHCGSLLRASEKGMQHSDREHENLIQLGSYDFLWRKTDNLKSLYENI